jgi:hypothetical protein
MNKSTESKSPRVYVTPLRRLPPPGRLRKRPMSEWPRCEVCTLICDFRVVESFLAIKEAIGLPPNAVIGGLGSKPMHAVLTPGKRASAIEAGAIEVTQAEAQKIAAKWRRDAANAAGKARTLREVFAAEKAADDAETRQEPLPRL